MVERPILRFPRPTHASRPTGSSRFVPRPQGPGSTRQGRTFQSKFDRLASALSSSSPETVLRSDPAGIAPERALVFETAGNIQGFTKAAQDAGLEVFTETELEGSEEFPEGFRPPGETEKLPRTLYATMPTLVSFQQILSLWRGYQSGRQAQRGEGPWWNMFNLLLDIRPWGPKDRLGREAKAVIEEILLSQGDTEIPIEIEVWPTTNADKRASWRQETDRKITDLGGRVLHTSSISESGFIYEAVLAELPPQAVRAMLDNPASSGGLATLDGIQFILPQTLGQATPGEPDGNEFDPENLGRFQENAPIHVALFDGTPMAGHAALDGGVVVEDIHDLVRLSTVEHRKHATAMASLILRGDLGADGRALDHTRLVSVPILVENENGTGSPRGRLFVDLVHTALTRLLTGDEPLAEDVFVVNFSICVRDSHFSGRISSLSRLLDWWAWEAGVLFIISSGNVSTPLAIQGMTPTAFEDSEEEQRRELIQSALRSAIYERTLLSPAESLNGLTVGAVSRDLHNHNPPTAADIFALAGDDEAVPHLTGALGLGLKGSIKPDLLCEGGKQEYRALANGNDLKIKAVGGTRTGLVSAIPGSNDRKTQVSRGTSNAAALTTRAILQSVAALVEPGGPYYGRPLSRVDRALLARALAVNSAKWPTEAIALYDAEKANLGPNSSARAKGEVCRHYGYGIITPELMQKSPDMGVTLVGLGSIQKNQARIFKLPLPPSLAGEDRIPRSMRVGLAWNSPVNLARVQYRLAGLEAVARDEFTEQPDGQWGINLKSESNGPDSNMIKRGSVWSRRLVNQTLRVPDFEEGQEISIFVQCRDSAGGGLSPDDEIPFAIAVTLEIETEVEYDVYQEIEQAIRLAVRPGAP